MEPPEPVLRWERPLIRIGYWSSPADDRWPDPRTLVDPGWDEDDRLDVGLYLRQGLVARACMGLSPCRLCSHDRNGSLELSDGTYIWPEGLAHYVIDHRVRLPQQFVDHVERARCLTDDAVVDDTWWRSLAR